MKSLDIAPSAAAQPGVLTPVTAGPHRLLLTRLGGRAYAVSERCPHLGFSMARARISGGRITCPWHGSTFDVRTGENLDWVCTFAGVPMPRWTHALIALGRQPRPVPTIAVDERGGRLFIELPDDGA